MEVQYVHVKTRAQFGKQCIFEDEGPTIIENLPPNRELANDYIHRNPCHVGVQNSKQFAIHEAQTTSSTTKESGMSHTEGGWPKEMNFKDEEATARFRRRVEKDDIWPIKMNNLLESMERCVLQNNAVNLYENFFDDMVSTELVLPLEVRTVNVYEDPQTLARPITHLSWSPDHGKRLAVSYCSREFERQPVDRNPWSYIWEIENPNRPFMALKAFCPSVTIEFNPRDPSMLVSGLMSGQVCNWDIRQGDKPVQMSHLQFSHRNPTNLALWINSKTNTEFFSASTGGMIKWWDLRKLREPTETLIMDLENPLRGDPVRAIGVSSLQFEPTMGTKFMAGMENGIVVSGTRKGKNAQEKLALRFSCHDGPVVGIDRNPFSTKNFLTVGGWVARIWAEDTREGNLISSKRGRIPLTGGAWSTSRYSVFYLIDESGLMNIYDILVGMKSPVKSIRLCQNGLKAISPHEEGTLVAVGSDMGKVYLVESSEGLTTNTRNDKVLMTTYLDRCSRYEKAVDNRLKEIRLVQRISIEQVEEPVPPVQPVSPTKGKGKGVGKDARVIKDDNAAIKKTDGKGAGKAPALEDKGKAKGKTKKAKETAISTGDRELVEAEIRYFEVVNKETERYAEIAALEEGFGASSSPEPKRRKHEESKVDKEATGAATRRPAVPEKGEETKKVKGRKSRAERVTKAENRLEEIVIVRKTKGDKEEERRAETELKMDEHNELETINEKSDDDTMIPEVTKKIKDRKETDKTPLRTSTKGQTRKTGGKGIKMKKPCSDYVCEPDICCLDQMSASGKFKPEKEKAVATIDPSTNEMSETVNMIEEMLTNLPKVASPEDLGHLLDPIELEKSDRSIFARKDAPPTVLDAAVKRAKRETREWQDSIVHGKPTSPRKLHRRKQKIIEDYTTFEATFQDSDHKKINRKDSKFIDQANSSSERISIDLEVRASSERENYTERSEKEKKRMKVKKPADCEPVFVKFGEKEIKNIIGVPDAPTPSRRPRFDESTVKIIKTKHEYPRISAAALPKVDIKDDSNLEQ